MTPYYQDALTTIYCTDARRILAELAYDVVLTDPVWPNCPAGLLPGAENAYALFAETVPLLTAKRVVVVMRSDSDPRFLSCLPATLPFFRLQILPYVMPGYIGRKLGGDEIAYSFGEPIPSVPGMRVIPGYAPKAQPQDRPANGHPCSRALIHFRWLVYWWSLSHETILDPFAGSGTTLVAAKQCGRKSVGIDISEDYCRLAVERLHQGVLPLAPRTPPSAPEQIGMFAAST